MRCQPGADSLTWGAVLAHRPVDQRAAAAARFDEAGIPPDVVAAALGDGGDALHCAAASERPGWADTVGGPLAVALLAAEIGSLFAHLGSRAAAVRGKAVDELMEEFSAVTVATRLGVSRQKVYDIARTPHAGPFLDATPWSAP